ncbi:MAG: acyl-CoA thioesterase [Saprospiraceae bacterium]|nr:acyl-CoA thioesterase [Saprospiraceae bacterium]
MDGIHNLAETFPSTLEIVVQWGDMDAAGHVNNATYLRWFETARIRYLADIGMDVVNPSQNIDFILGWQECKYIFPVTFPDTVHIGIRVTAIREDRLVMQARMFSGRHQRLVAIANGDMVTYDYRLLKKVLVSEDLISRVSAFEKTTF